MKRSVSHYLPYDVIYDQNNFTISFYSKDSSNVKKVSRINGDLCRSITRNSLYFPRKILNVSWYSKLHFLRVHLYIIYNTVIQHKWSNFWYKDLFSISMNTIAAHSYIIYSSIQMVKLFFGISIFLPFP